MGAIIQNDRSEDMRVSGTASSQYVQRTSGQLAGRNALFQQIVGILSSSSTLPLTLVCSDPLCPSGMKRTNPYVTAQWGKKVILH